MFGLERPKRWHEKVMDLYGEENVVLRREDQGATGVYPTGQEYFQFSCGGIGQCGTRRISQRGSRHSKAEGPDFADAREKLLAWAATNKRLNTVKDYAQSCSNWRYRWTKTLSQIHAFHVEQPKSLRVKQGTGSSEPRVSHPESPFQSLP